MIAVLRVLARRDPGKHGMAKETPGLLMEIFWVDRDIVTGWGKLSNRFIILVKIYYTAPLGNHLMALQDNCLDPFYCPPKV